MQDMGASPPAWAIVRAARARAGLTQRQLAARAGTSQAAIGRYERGRSIPDLATLGRLVDACGLELRLSMTEPDQHDAELIREHVRRTPRQRVSANRSATRLLAKAAHARAAGRVRPLVDA